jgi:hypothetical protein
MSIDRRYFDYLDHLGRTDTVRALQERPDARDVVALRHDVDHDLDLALEMAFWEHHRGCRASYYLLHTAEYWHDEQLVDKCLQLQDFGHEVGLHVNVVAEWVRGEIDDVDTRLSELLWRLRQGGVEVVGVSAHGDRLCYERGFINYWMFGDVRPDEPDVAESGRSAEGLTAHEARFRIDYPPEGFLERDDGKVLSLWTSSLEAHGLTYHAYHVPSDRYLTDSGSSWTRSPDPRELDCSKGRYQILMHPVYYRGPQRLFLFLSTARSGSRWLTEALDVGTSVTARHEFMLNHRYAGGELVSDKHTGAGFRSLMHQPAKLRQLIADVRTWVEHEVVGDWAEANVYLVHALHQLEHYFGDGTWVHLHRHPFDVVRSLFQRGWYETSEDDHHPALDVEGWDSLAQLEKTCHYVRRVNEQLLGLGLPRIALEGVAADMAELQRRLVGLEVASYPRLLAGAHTRVVNASLTQSPPFERWSADARRTVQRICGPIAAALGYERNVNLRSRVTGRLRYQRVPAAKPDEDQQVAPHRPTSLVSTAALSDGTVPLAIAGGTLASVEPQHVVVHPDGERHTWIFLGGGGLQGLDDGAGLPSRAWTFVSGRLRLEIDGAEGVTGAMFALWFDARGELQGRRRLRNLAPGDGIAAVSFKPPANCVRFVLAVYIPLTPDMKRVRLLEVQLEQLPVRATDSGG